MDNRPRGVRQVKLLRHTIKFGWNERGVILYKIYNITHHTDDGSQKNGSVGYGLVAAHIRTVPVTGVEFFLGA